MRLSSQRPPTLLPIHGGVLEPQAVGGWKYRQPEFLSRGAPCAQACPLGNRIAAVLGEIVLGRPREAARRLRETNPLPAVLGRVCPHPCERECNRGGLDSTLAVSAIERMVGEVPISGASTPGTPDPGAAPASGLPVAVIGAGPSGLACAHFLARLGHRPTVFEAMGEPGGMMRYGIPAYRLPREVVEGEVERIARGGVEIRTGARLGVDFGLDDLASRGFRAVYEATGAWEARRPAAVPAQGGGVLSGTAFLLALNTGSPPVCQGSVAVVGGGDVAIDVARSALRLGASGVTMLALEDGDSLPAVGEGVEQARAEGVRILAGVEVVAVEQAAKAGSRRLRSERVRLVGFERGAPRTERLGGDPIEVSADILVYATGQSPAEANPLASSSIPVVRGGDAAGRGGTVARAAADGKRAAFEIDALLRGRERPATGPSGPPAGPVRFEEINTAYFPPSPARARPAPAAGFDPADPFRESVGPAGWDAAREEAARCFHCGECTGCENCLLFCPDMAIVRRDGGDGPFVGVDLDWCKGCGICAVECPRAVIGMVRAGEAPGRAPRGRTE